MIHVPPMTVQPRLIREFPKMWVYPLSVSPIDDGPAPGLVPALLGAWNLHEPFWRVQFVFDTQEQPVIPVFLVEELKFPRYRFTLALYDGVTWKELRMN
jgi:hypothetical protein